LASELMKVELLTVNDVNRVINEVFNLNKLFIAYLGNSVEIKATDYNN